MLLTVDVGNTNIKLGLFENSQRIAFDMLDSNPIDFKSFILSFLYKANIRETQLDDSIMSSVVPSLTPLVFDALKEITNKVPYTVDNDHLYGIEIDPTITDVVGADLLVTCAYAYQTYRRELLLVSLGTASVIAHVSQDGKFKNCLIAPGFNAMANAIYSKAEQLPEFSPERNKSFLANSTIEAMNIGVYDGYIGMIKYLINGAKREVGSNPIVIGCGGVGKDVAKYISEFFTYDPDLVTTGLCFIYNRYIKI